MPHNDYDIPVPGNSQTAFWASTNTSPQNAGLVFDRFTPRLDNVGSGEKSGEIKKKAFNRVIHASKRSDRDLFADWVKRWKKNAEAVNAKPFSCISDWRLVTGLGSKGTLETGFTFNRYGFPYLPGSSLKGLARMAALTELSEKIGTQKLDDLDETLAKDEQDAFLESFKRIDTGQQGLDLANLFRKVFGTTAQAGCAIFLDAIPETLPRLDLDIMNPHYPDYYQGKEPPTNWQSPQPIYFLTVAPKTTYLFAVGWRSGTPDITAFDQAKRWLSDGLQTLGIGAKTSAGYGFFTIPVEPPAPLPPGYLRGTVVSFGAEGSRSYGFIHADGSAGKDLFVHQSKLASGLTTLKQGQRVIFKRVKIPNKDDQAQDVRLDE